LSLNLETIPHHPALQEIVDVICTRRRTKDRSFFQAEVAYYLGKMASTMRASMSSDSIGDVIVNIYSMALAPSGYGKGHSITIMEDEFLKSFRERFENETFPVLAEQNLWVIANARAARTGADQQEEFERTKKEFDRFGPYTFTFDSGTVAGVKDMRTKLLLGGAAALNLQVDEIGSNLTGSMDMLTLLLELYDNGKVKQKLTKNTNDNPRSQEIDGKTPTNMLLFGAPAKLFDGAKTEQEFYSLLETGYARRCIFGYGTVNRSDVKKTAAEIYEDLTTSANDGIVTKWARHFYTLADPALFGWKMTVPEDVAIQLLEYQLECEAKAEAMAEHEEIQKAEVSHRHSKALKLAGAYAFIDQSIEVEMHHLLAAIKMIEESGKAFEVALSREKPYERLAKFIAGSKAELTHADIHEKLTFYPKSGATARNDMMMLATSWGYKNNVIIKKTFVDGIEFFKGETLEKTDLNKLIVSYSNNWAYEYRAEVAPFAELYRLAQAEDMHWTNHHFKDGHRTAENALAGFNMIVLDVDHGVTVETAHELLKDYKFLTYTTKRHQTEGHGDRFRIMMPINYRLNLDSDEYKEFMRNIFAWLPFATDESYEKREKKSESYAGGEVLYNVDGQILDVLPFIPKTSRNEQHKQQSQALGSLDNLERWFAGHIANGNRNNQMIKYALCLVDNGWDLPTVRSQVHAFNSKLSDPMSEQEIDSSILVTVAKRYQPK
jgi:hypothetical protein